MEIKMTCSRFGSPDGYIVERYEKDIVYDMPDRLARSFIARGYGVPANGFRSEPNAD